MNFKYINDTKVSIDGKNMIIRMEKGMTGIGSRKYYINGKEQLNNCVYQTDNLEEGNHLIYTIYWRPENGYDEIDIIISEKYEKDLLSEENKNMNPRKIIFQ